LFCLSFFFHPASVGDKEEKKSEKEHKKPLVNDGSPITLQIMAVLHEDELKSFLSDKNLSSGLCHRFLMYVSFWGFLSFFLSFPPAWSHLLISMRGLFHAFALGSWCMRLL
jgi:hypothetical protein